MDDLWTRALTKLSSAKLTVAEAAYVTKVSVKDIDREIDAKVLRPSGPKGARALKRGDLVYLKAIGPIRSDLNPGLRRKVCLAVGTAVAKRLKVAKVETLEVPIKEIEAEILEEFTGLEDLRRTMIESRPAVLGGEPVLKGTRIPVRVVADLVKKGATAKDLKDEFNVTPAQMRAAVLFDQIRPRRGRPPRVRRKTTVHVPADR